MIRAIVAASAMIWVAACSAPAADMPLAGLDLNDARVVGKIARQLPDGQRRAFTTYALVHWPGSKNYCGNPIGLSRQTARTVGEAVAQTLRFEAELAKTRLAAQAGPTSQVDRLRERQMLLTDQIEELVRKRDALYGQLGAAAATAPESKQIEQKMMDLRDQRAALESQFTQIVTTRL
ncbi:MAG: hypothetical protein J0I69_14060 [Altererythrobacter sp.]|nr:hypothetical protein [Altererythrobacter sp.]OJU59080.1 MAG: hypothetical protein BGO08_05275 [Altererythrobacter sp. 66-12]